MTVTIKEGGYYVTRDGRKIGPVVLNTSEWRTGMFPWTCDGLTWRGDGAQCGNGECKNDLIFEWVDSPVPLKIEVGKYYQTVSQIDLWEAWPMRIGPMSRDPRTGLFGSPQGEKAWREDGSPALPNYDRIVREFVPPTAPPAPSPVAADIKAEIADEAKRIVTGARRSAYGTPEQNFDRIARFWQAYFENTGRADARITAADVSPLMRLMKEARICETPDHRDSHVDLVGYALTGAEVNGVAPLKKAGDLS